VVMALVVAVLIAVVVAKISALVVVVAVVKVLDLACATLSKMWSPTPAYE